MPCGHPSTRFPNSSEEFRLLHVPREKRDFLDFRRNPITQEIVLQFIPRLFFVCGTLQVPEVLRKVLGVPEAPVYFPASVSEFGLKVWNVFPALVVPNGTPSAAAKNVQGSAFTVDNPSHLDKLLAFTRRNYQLDTFHFNVTRFGREERVLGKGFTWSGPPEHLLDREFDKEKMMRVLERQAWLN